MAYFPNGTSAMAYEEDYCDHCVHQEQAGGCPVWTLHLLYNYQDCDNDESFLHVLIPRTPDGLGNEQCRMFYRKQKEAA